MNHHKALKGAGQGSELDASQLQNVVSDLLPSDSLPAEVVSPSQKGELPISEHRPHQSVHAHLLALLLPKNKV